MKYEEKRNTKNTQRLCTATQTQQLANNLTLIALETLEKYMLVYIVLWCGGKRGG